jgi:hypothetical protein
MYSVSKAPILNIKFVYSFKRDMSPLSIMKFKNNSGYIGITTWAESLDISIKK